MAHPNKKESSEATGRKLASMTRDYGMADKAKMQYTPTSKFKIPGPEENHNYGANYDASTPRSDKPARKSITSNPIATYARGGKVRADGGATDVDVIEEANKDQAASESLERARGGKTSKKGGHTHVNVIVAPQGAGGQGGPQPVPNPQLAALAGGLKPPMAGGPPPGPPMGGPPMAPPMGGGAPPMPPQGAPMPRKSGGRTSMPAETEKMMHDEGLIRKARGGGITIKAGADSGVGRLQKIKAWEGHGNKSAPEVASRGKGK